MALLLPQVVYSPIIDVIPDPLPPVDPEADLSLSSLLKLLDSTAEQLTSTWHVGKNIVVFPTVQALWEHEYKISSLPITASAVAFPGVSATFFGPHEGHDSLILDAGVGTQWTDRISAFVGYQGQPGRDNYSANGVTGTMSFAF